MVSDISLGTHRGTPSVKRFSKSLQSGLQIRFTVSVAARRRRALSKAIFQIASKRITNPLYSFPLACPY